MKKTVIYMAAALFGAAPAMNAAVDALNGADRVIVLEDFTSVDCGWCPRGIALCEYAAETYPGTVIPLAYHDLDFNTSNPDPMGSESGQEFVRRYASRLARPAAFINRQFSGTDYCSDISMNLPEIAAAFDADYAGLRAGGSFVGMDMEIASASEDNMFVDATVALDFVLDLPKASDLYSLTFVVTEDGVGPYAQKNYYSNTSYKCGEWVNRASKPKVKHNHVVRDLIGLTGVSGSVAAGLAKGDQHSFTQQISTVNVAGNEFTVVAMLIDTQTNEVVNACAKTFSKADEPDPKPDPDPNGVETIAADGSADAPAQWFTVQGVSVSRPEAPGIYIMKQGREVSKIVVR